MSTNRENFGSRAAVIMAMAGSAIGLGNIWRFPYMVGEYGGAAFVLIYFICTFLLSYPIFMTESVIGRRSRSNAIGAMNYLAPKSFWRVLGYLSVITPIIILSYYSIVGGWSLDYFFKSFSLNYGDFVPSGGRVLLFNTLFLSASSLVVALGVKTGIEKFSKYSIPLLFILIVVIMIYSVNMPGADKGIDYLLRPDFSKITPKSFAYALGQSFYSLSLGSGIIITYSSYIHSDENIVASGIGTTIADMAFAILAGFAIMPAVFASGLEPSSGPGLIFQTLPHIFTHIGGNIHWLSSLIAVLFFLTVIVAAMTSAISLMEVGVAYLVEGKRIKRGWATLIIFSVIWLLGLCSVFSTEIFGIVDSISSNFLLTSGALLAVLFVGWKMKKEDVRDEITNGGTKKVNSKLFPVAYFLIRYVAPIVLVIIFITGLL